MPSSHHSHNPSPTPPDPSPTPDRAWQARYRRQLSLRGFGLRAQHALSTAHVAVVGAGGLGSPAILYLAAAGVGHLTIIDDDRVELSNLHRQVIHRDSAIGTPKAHSAAAEARARADRITITPITARLTADSAVDLLSGADLVIDGTDNFAARYAIDAACAELNIPHVWASILGFDAQLAVFGLGLRYSDLFPTAPPPGAVPTCAEAGVLGPLVGIIGSAMALEALKILSGVGTPLASSIGYFSGLSGRWEYIDLATPTPSHSLGDAAPAPTTASSPAHSPTPDSLTVDPATGMLLIDVREAEEFVGTRIPGAHNIPLSTLREAVPGTLLERCDGSTEVLLYCAAGVRSLEALRLITAAGGTGMRSLDGGIEAWLDGEVELTATPPQA